jgi:hypothetical protein
MHARTPRQPQPPPPPSPPPPPLVLLHIYVLLLPNSVVDTECTHSPTVDIVACTAVPRSGMAVAEGLAQATGCTVSESETLYPCPMITFSTACVLLTSTLCSAARHRTLLASKLLSTEHTSSLTANSPQHSTHHSVTSLPPCLFSTYSCGRYTIHLTGAGGGGSSYVGGLVNATTLGFGSGASYSVPASGATTASGYVEGVASGGSGTVGGPGLAIVSFTSRVSV